MVPMFIYNLMQTLERVWSNISGYINMAAIFYLLNSKLILRNAVESLVQFRI